jgi:glycosyltransferase involved in cell wall biosynthesis
MIYDKRFSFVIPTYQNKNLIRNTLEALNRQKDFPYEDYEVIVVDDGSSDGTGEVLDRVVGALEFILDLIG